MLSLVAAVGLFIPVIGGVAVNVRNVSKACRIAEGEAAAEGAATVNDVATAERCEEGAGALETKCEGTRSSPSLSLVAFQNVRAAAAA